VIALAVSPLLTRLLGPAAFGVFGVYLAVLGSLGAAASWRLGLAVPIPADDREGSAVVVAGVVATILSTALVVLTVALGGGWIAAELLRAPEVAPFLWFVPLSILGVGLTDVLSGWCLRHKEFPAMVRQRVVRSLGTSGWQVAHALVTHTSALALVVGDVVGRLWSVVAMARRIWRSEGARSAGLRWSEVRAALKAHRAFALVTTPSTLVNAVGQWAPVILLTLWWGPVAAGLYVIGQRVIGVPIGLLGDSAGQVYIADLAASARAEPAAMPRLFSRTAVGLAKLAVVTALLLLVFAPVAFRIAFGAEWQEAGVMVRWQSVALAIQIVAIPMAHTLVVLRFQHRQLAWDIARLVATVAAFIAAERLGWSAVGSVALHGVTTAVLYGALIVLSWRAVALRSRSDPARPTHPDGPPDGLRF
jgi:O-antigen/teichoic acid export membrane protein